MIDKFSVNSGAFFIWATIAEGCSTIAEGVAEEEGREWCRLLVFNFFNGFWIWHSLIKFQNGFGLFSIWNPCEGLESGKSTGVLAAVVDRTIFWENHCYNDVELASGLWNDYW